MCGIIGVISDHERKDLGALIGHGLYQLQSRGDFSAGIATIMKLPMSRKDYRHNRLLAVDSTISDFDPMHIIKGRGRVDEVFKEGLDDLVGFMGIGQDRYPTAGYTISSAHEKMTDDERAALQKASIQPLYTSQFGRIVMVHNGDVHNFREVMDYFEEKGSRQATYNDLEAVLKVFSEKFFSMPESTDNAERIAKSVQEVYARVKGTYSVLAMINNVGLVAFRDPQGRRPLHFGVNKENGKITDYAFASETVALEKMLFKGTLDEKYDTGDHAYDQVKPGEMVFISKDFQFTRKQVAPPDLKFCPFEIAYFARAASFINNKRVKTMREEMLGYILDRFQAEHPDVYERIILNGSNTVVVPVPHTAASAAQELANQLSQYGVTYRSAIEKNPFSGRIFQTATQKHRERKTLADHIMFKEHVKGKTVLLVDDSIVRGTTLERIVKYLRDMEAKEVHVFITFPEIRNPCNHAIDFHTSEELFAHGKNYEQMKKALGLFDYETLTYALPSELSRAIGLPLSKLCDECYRVA
jgi:amidophosphoribosyltransferase